MEELQTEQECPTDMNSSFLNRVQITQQFLELLLCQIDVKGKIGGYNVKKKKQTWRRSKNK